MAQVSQYKAAIIYLKYSNTPVTMGAGKGKISKRVPNCFSFTKFMESPKSYLFSFCFSFPFIELVFFILNLDANKVVIPSVNVGKVCFVPCLLYI